MKKKRFLKLVMSYGIQRDKAARMAARVGEFGSYEALFLSLRPSLAFWQMGAAARRAGRTIRQAARAFGDMRRNGDSHCRMFFPCFARVC